MAENKLQNAGFEADWGEESSHRALVIPASGVGQVQDIGNIFTPPGWLAWFRHEAGKWDQPEVRDARKSGDPLRVHSGEKSILLFTFYRRHDAGFLQTADVTPGKLYRLEAWSHAWSNHEEKQGAGSTPDFPHPDDPRWSEGAPLVGHNSHVSLRPEQIPLLVGDKQIDAVGNFLFTLGLDPLGTGNPLADSVVWGTPVANYNGHSPVPAVEAVAQGSTMTVVLRSTTLWAFKHNDAYWDDASLIEVDGQPSTGRGAPRIQYAREYWVVDATLPLARRKEIYTQAAEENKTAGPSFDDAGIGDLDDRTARLWDIPGIERQAYLDFYRDYYPGVKVEWAGGVEPDPLNKWRQYAQSQRDPFWADVRRYGALCTTTIGADGCWDTCCAMAQNILGLRENASPVTVNEELGPGGVTSGCQVTWAAMKSKATSACSSASGDHWIFTVRAEP